MKKQKFSIKEILTILVVFISCSNPSEPEKPQISVYPTSFNFSKNINSGNLTISNSNGGELSWEITDKPDWLHISKNSGKVTTGKDTVIATVNLDQGAGEYEGTMKITSNAMINASQ